MSKHFRFTVEGALNFPLDMLRYDRCWPASQDDVVRMSEAVNVGFVERTERRFKITLHGIDEPTLERWISFGWHVTGLSRV